MARNIFIVNAYIVDANGTFNVISGYPKNFDSNTYNYDVDKALKRAQGELAETWGAMCKRDDRQLQVVTLTQANGALIDRKSDGFLQDPVIPEPEEEG